MRLVHLLPLFAGLLACRGGADATGFADLTEHGATTAAPDASTSSAPDSGPPPDDTTTTSGALASTSTTVNDPMLWDMGVPDIGTSRLGGCQGKIDFLFIISADGTMVGHQQELKDSLPGFIDTLQAQIPSFDLHIVVADADGYWGMQDCSLCTDNCDPTDAPPLCGASLTACDVERGAGVTYPVGVNSSNRRCKLPNGRRYIDSTQDDIAESFACIARVGSGASNSRTQDALVEALEDPAGCNQGFLRHDALLIVTIIQDRFDEDSASDPLWTLKALRVAKKNDDDAFALLALTTDLDVDANGLCHPGLFASPPNPLRVFASKVKHSSIASICQKNFDDFFADSVAKIVELCDGYVPPPG